MKNKKLFISLIILVLCGIAITIYSFGPGNNHQIITLYPDNAPLKKKPDDPGGIIIPNTDSLVYEKLQKSPPRNRKVNILPSPESPLDIMRGSETDNIVFVDSIDQILANIEEYSEENLEELDNKGDRVNIGQVKATTNSATEEQANKIIIPGIELNISKAKTAIFNNLDSKPKKNKGYKIQLTIASSSGEALNKWNQIIKRHGRILAGAEFLTERIEGTNNKIFYTVMAGNYLSLGEAKLACKKLISKKQHCIIVY